MACKRCAEEAELFSDFDCYSGDEKAAKFAESEDCACRRMHNYARSQLGVALLCAHHPRLGVNCSTGLRGSHPDVLRAVFECAVPKTDLSPTRVWTIHTDPKVKRAAMALEDVFMKASFDDAEGGWEDNLLDPEKFDRITEGVDLRMFQGLYDSAMHVAVLLDDAALVKHIASKDPSMLRIVSHEEEPIHSAVCWEKHEALRALIECGCNVNAIAFRFEDDYRDQAEGCDDETEEALTPLDMARVRKNETAHAMLLRAGGCGASGLDTKHHYDVAHRMYLRADPRNAHWRDVSKRHNLRNTTR
jgi:hypothetical protein